MSVRNLGERSLRYLVNFREVLLTLGLFVFLLDSCVPGAQQFIDRNFSSRSAWYYLGASNSKGDWHTPRLQAEDGTFKPVLRKHFYHIKWNNTGIGGSSARVNSDLIAKAIYSIVVPTVDFPIMGRDHYRFLPDDGSVSNNPVIAVAFKGECLYVTDYKADPSVAPLTAYWILAKKVTCQ